MMVLQQGRSTGVAARACPDGSTVQWNEPLDAVLEQMCAAGCDEVLVLQGDSPVGRITRAAIERLRRQGNWIGCIAAADAMDRRIA